MTQRISVEEARLLLNPTKKKDTGNKKVKGACKVDESGVTITDFHAWRERNPSALYFDSRLEWHMWAGLLRMGVAFDLKPKKLICEGWRHPDGKWMAPITISYDFGFPWCNEIVDTKGHPTPDFILRHRLFQWYQFQQGDLPVIRLLSKTKEVDAYLYAIKDRYSKWKKLEAQ